MERSLSVPTATSFRTLPVKLLEENRSLLNQHLAEGAGGKASFTHFLAWALVRALRDLPALRAVFLEQDGEPFRAVYEHIHLGLAVDIQRKDGSRGLLVPNLRNVEGMDFATFFAAYNELLRKVQANQLIPDDFAGTTHSLTNPGMLGTTQSVARLMTGQSFILAAGSIAYPAEYQQGDPQALALLGVSRVMTLACTYDHRIIQGAESGTFLGRMADLLSGADAFYDEIFASLHVPHRPHTLHGDRNPHLAPGSPDALAEKHAAVLRLINMYRVRGHLVAHLNPLGSEIPSHPELELSRYGLSVWDLDRTFITGGLGDRRQASLRDILRILQEAYCGTIGLEFMHIQEPDQRIWLQQRMENIDRTEWLQPEEKRRILTRLNDAEAFERFLHTKYIGHKRFSLEGNESLIPMVDRLLTHATEAGISNVVMGMAHRGRLNVLANILNKGYDRIFREFEGNLDPLSREGTGDVKYHLGADGTFSSPSGASLHVTLASNPSHLEAVNPVVEGMARALQDMRGDRAHQWTLPLLVHGDAAFAGQGVVAETLNMSALAGYRTGGTVHIVVNNGIGFTTSPSDARSSVYATDVAKMVQAPIFHVNGDDPEACVRVCDLALAFRNTFRKDVVVDVIGYRRHGHNESDEPAFTQPKMYARIRDKRSVRKLYTELLVNRGDMTLEEAERMLDDFHDRLEAAFAATRESTPPEVCLLPATEDRFQHQQPPPSVTLDTLQQIAERLATLPDGFSVHPKLARLLASRRESVTRGTMDWGTAELLALGTLLLEGVPVRMAGQDTRRGTFSQRHSTLVDQVTGEPWVPLQHLDPGQAPFMVIDSLLSEYAAMGFEYGYSVAWPETLVVWEAQFGDFANGAQIIIDQFLAASEEKWRQLSGLVLLLPHGHEGQGPEHSSARLERFLQLCAANNMRVAVPTTAAQYFHLLRSQAHLEQRRPLVVLTPKSLLRAEEAKADAAALTSGVFQPLLADPEPPGRPERLVLCSGKVVYDLLRHRREHSLDSATIVRVEQVYPFPSPQIGDLLERHGTIREVCWVQEEPRNMGAWTFVAPQLREVLDDRPLYYAGRAANPSPATGSFRLHEMEQQRLVIQALAPGGK